MAKITVAASGNPDDPFGDYRPAHTVDVPDDAPTRDTFRFATGDSFLPSSSLAPGYDHDAANYYEKAAGKYSFPNFKFVKSAQPDPSSLTGLEGDGIADPDFKCVKFASSSIFEDVGFGEDTSINSFTKGTPTEFHKFATFTKIQETSDGNVLVWGIATHEKPDLDGEICDYDTAVPVYKSWSGAAKARTEGAGQELSLGNVRHQHTTEPAGKVTKIQYDDANKAIWLGSIPISDDIRKELQQGFLTGYSQGGSYAWRKCADCDKSLSLQQANNYCPNCKKNVQVLYGLKRLSEVSYVDSPCTGQGFDYVKADGTSRFVSFAKRSEQPSAAGFKILSTVSISRKISKVTALIDGRKRTIVVWPGACLLT